MSRKKGDFSTGVPFSCQCILNEKVLLDARMYVLTFMLDVLVVKVTVTCMMKV